MTRTLPLEAQVVLDYWFGEIVDDFCVQDHSKLWFSADTSLDREIRQRFGERVEEATDGRLRHWCETPQGRLALIVLLDQFSRNIYRGTARAFAQDAVALEHCLEGLRVGHDGELTAVERTFFYLPLEHSERLEDQELCVASFERLMDELPPAKGERLRQSLQYAIHHRDIVRQFGRFPHRNRILARESTGGERRYLDEGGATFGQ
jgi:uncharacterized protein (DUF924 family)